MKAIINFLLCSMLLFSACNKKEDADSPVINEDETYELNIDSDWSMRARVNGVDYKMSEVNGAIASMYVYTTTHFPNYDYDFVTRLTDAVTLRITFNGFEYPVGEEIPEEEFLNFLAPRNYSYVTTVQNHITVEFIDQSGEHWDTDFASQGGSEFRIVDAKLIPGNPDFNVKVYCRFRCFLINHSGGSIILNDGEYVGLLKSK